MPGEKRAAPFGLNKKARQTGFCLPPGSFITDYAIT
jgi:hypothetical protein